MNINEIAKLAGVSRATVSRYLNQGYVSAEKKQAIRQVIENTGYEPSSQAQNLRRKVTKLIGVIIPCISSESVSRMVEGISGVLAKEGYQLLLANTQNDEREELKYLKIFRKNHVDGVIFMGTIFSEEHFRLMGEVEVPLVVIGQCVKEYTCVYHDDYHAAYDAAGLLLRTGKKIGFLGVTEHDQAVGAERKMGFLEALREHGHAIVPENLVETDFNMHSGYEKTKELMEREPAIDSLFCVTDSLAIGALQYLHEAGIAVPEQVQLLGFDDTQMGSVVTPALTTVHFFYENSGQKVARQLLAILGSGQDLKHEVKMGYQVMEHASLR